MEESASRFWGGKENVQTLYHFSQFSHQHAYEPWKLTIGFSLKIHR
jgi:hypothetical protein